MLQQLFDLGIRTATVTRYSQSKLMREESVMEHTGQVALMALIIGRKCCADIEKLMTRAVIHDLEESELGDIANPVKYNNENIYGAIDNLAMEIFEGISNRFDDPALHQDWLYAKDTSLEGRIVKLCDVLSVLMKLYEEVIIYHNYSLVGHSENTLKWIRQRLEEEDNQVLLEILAEARDINTHILKRKDYADF